MKERASAPGGCWKVQSLRPAPTQERAAEQLHLSFSTYRRYRDRAVALMTEWLWQRELYGLDGCHPARSF
jgi:hypothetical protein